MIGLIIDSLSCQPRRSLLGLTNLTQQSGYDMFKKLGVSDLFVQEFVDGASRDNYGQPSTINGFVDLVQHGPVLRNLRISRESEIS